MSSWNCCRTCISTENLNLIFSTPKQSNKYSDIIATITGIKVVLNDSLPQQMCADCINIINNHVKFRKKCEMAQKILIERFNNNQFYDVKVEPEHIIGIESKIATIDISESYEENLDHLKNPELYCSPNFDYIDNLEIMIDKTENNDNINENNEEFVEFKAEIREVSENKPIDFIFKTTKSTRKTRLCNIKKPKKKLNSRTKKSKQDVENDQPVENNDEMESEKETSKIKKSTARVKEKIECEYCHKILTSKLSLRNHYKIHTGFDVVCEHCGKKFITRRLLLMHCRAKHGYEKTDKCSFCDYRASNAEQVKIHERLHTGEKPYVCRDCGAGFHRKSSYLQHVAIHLPDKTVQCDQCPARFKSVTLMRIHKNRHKQPQYSFKCYICHSNFARRRNVIRHLQRIHAIVSDLHEIERVKLG